jgi:hypothetical protein
VLGRARERRTNVETLERRSARRTDRVPVGERRLPIRPASRSTRPRRGALGSSEAPSSFTSSSAWPRRSSRSPRRAAESRVAGRAASGLRQRAAGRAQRQAAGQRAAREPAGFARRHRACPAWASAQTFSRSTWTARSPSAGAVATRSVAAPRRAARRGPGAAGAIVGVVDPVQRALRPGGGLDRGELAVAVVAPGSRWKERKGSWRGRDSVYVRWSLAFSSQPLHETSSQRSSSRAGDFPRRTKGNA